MSILRSVSYILSCLILCIPASFPVYAASDAALRLNTVVIDAGHGGHDPGAVADGARIREKDITLDVAVKLSERIRTAFPGMKVILTRDKDVYIPLVERSAIANRNKADLFISVHVNSTGRSSSARGTETFLMGTDKSESNMAVCRTENSVILLEDDYSTKYAGYDPDAPDSFIFFNLMQNAQFEQSVAAASSIENAMSSGPIAHSRGIKQAPLLVLWKTTMPAVLVEIGFLSNPQDKALLCDKKKRDAIADCLFKGFVDYKTGYEGQAGTETVLTEKAGVPETPAVKVETLEKAAESWSIQVFSNPQDKALLCDKKKRDAKADCLIKGFVDYKTGYEGQAGTETVLTEKAGVPETPAVKVETLEKAAESWSIQVFSISRKLSPRAPEMKGEKLRMEKSGNVYKYYLGHYTSRDEAAADLQRARAKFPGAFLVCETEAPVK